VRVATNHAALLLEASLIIFYVMSTLAEIEAAVEKLPPTQQKALFDFLAERLGRHAPAADDPVTDVIGAFAGQPGSTGRHAEEILYALGEAA
jgi:hypothetical protein